MEQTSLIPHLFRTEYSRIVAVLVKLLGMTELETAEDIAAETFLTALELWPYKGIPPNPHAWLYTVAKNKARNRLARQQLFQQKIRPQLQHGQTGMITEREIDLSEQHITDSQLQMLFAVCHPILSVESQIGLALRVLCGFGIDEIATALLSNKETIHKRLTRAKENLREARVPIVFPGNSEIPQRLDTVLKTLYLLFSEGYYSESHDAVLREDLCLEAMRLVYLLIGHESTNLPKVNALLSLMCFHASRFEARKTENGEIILYNEQDETLWNRELISKGVYYMHEAAKGSSFSKYHLEAGIAYWHTIKNDTPEKWENILQLYNRLLQLEYSPIAALNRTYALAKVHGREAAIAEAEKLQLNTNPYYFTLLAELYTGIDTGKAIQYLQKAMPLAKTKADLQTIRKKLAAVAG